MSRAEPDPANELLDLLAEGFAERLAEKLAPLVAALIQGSGEIASPWMDTKTAISYTGLPAGTFRKLASSGVLPSHGGRAKLFFRPELDEALMSYRGIAERSREIRRVA
jgi:hypothetical protein